MYVVKYHSKNKNKKEEKEQRKPMKWMFVSTIRSDLFDLILKESQNTALSSSDYEVWHLNLYVCMFWSEVNQMIANNV